MRRRRFLLTSLAGAVGAPLVAGARAAGGVARIGVLGLAPASAGGTDALETFRAGLRDLGHTEGQTFVIEYRWANGQPERLPALAAELVRSRPDVIFAPTTPAALAARQGTRTIPIVGATRLEDVLAAGT